MVEDMVEDTVEDMEEDMVEGKYNLQLARAFTLS